MDGVWAQGNACVRTDGKENGVNKVCEDAPMTSGKAVIMSFEFR